MKTVFLFLRQGISNRNLLRTDFLKTLKEHPDVRVVILSPIGEEPEFRKEFESGNVCVEKWPRTKVGFWEKRLKNLKSYVWVSRGLTQAGRIKSRVIYGPMGLAWRDVLGMCARGVGVTEAKINDWEMGLYKNRPAIQYLYEKYQPDLLIFTRLFGTNLHVVKEAKKRRVPVLCLVESWDNLVSKGPLSVVPDRMAVWNGMMREEAQVMHGFPSERVDVIGVPQFDLYADPSKLIERAVFFERFGLDPNRKLVTYGTSTEGLSHDEPETIEILYRALQEGCLGYPAQLLLRLHPITSPGLKTEYERRFSGRPDLVVQQPGRLSRLHDGWDPTTEDMFTLAATIYYSDVLVNVASTISLDAIALDTPVVCIGFDGKTKRPYYQSCRKILDYEHLKNLYQTGAYRIAYEPEKMIRYVKEYLGHPELHAKKRERARREFCYRLDGQSARRATEVVLRELGIGLRQRGRSDWAGNKERFLSVDHR